MKTHKNQICLLFIALGFGLMSAGTSHAMSTLLSMSAEPMWPTSSTPDGNLVYNVTTVGRGGSGLLEVTLTAGAMPPGVTVTFSPNVVRFTGNQLSAQNTTMTVFCPLLLPLDCFPFTITGTSQRGETITITNQVMFSPAELANRVPTLIVDKLTNGGFMLRGSGATGKIYQIESTPSLSRPVVWTPMGSSTADGNGRFSFFPGLATTNGPVRFFRAVTSSGPVANP
jgi:hypothetical protein